MGYKIYPISLGRNETMEKSVLTYRLDYGKPATIAFLVYLIKGEGVNILVDSGPPSAALAEQLGLPAVHQEKSLKDELYKLGVSCSDIDFLIMTHLHWDHCFNMELFPKKKVYVQTDELWHAVNPSPYERRAYMARPEDLTPGWVAAFNCMECIDGDAEIIPGIRVIALPGHTKGGQAVLVDTDEGTYMLCGDQFPLLENWEKCIPNGISISFEDWYNSYKKVANLDVKVLPGHDEAVLQRTVYG